jgi:glutamate-1-semialdehyde 2,1-aminomutase
MFALFFSDQRVENYADATTSETAYFAKLFKQCLELGVYLPPSAYETCFISTAHQGDDIEQAAELIGQALRQL